MRKAIKSIVSFSIILIISVINCMAVSAQPIDEDYSYKLSDELISILSEKNNSDVVCVSVWFKDIDKNEIVESSKKYLRRLMLNLSIPSRENLSWDIEHTSKMPDFSLDSMQDIVNLERDKFTKKYEESNTNYLLSLLNNELIDDEYQPEIIYVCKLAPNIVIKLTKEQIYSVVELNCVDSIYLQDENECLDTDSIEEASSEDESESTYSTDRYDLTKVSYMRDTFNATGEGIKVGLLDEGYLYNTTADYFENSNIIKHSDTTYYTDTVHADLVASILVGKQSDYTGIVPDAELYYVERSIGFKQGIELLINTYNVNVINISISIGNYNTYNDYSKWMDHVISTHHVAVVMSSGNIVPADNTTGVYSANMAYNVITVGGLDDKNTPATSDDILYAASRYNFTDNYGYKPDLIAPAVEIRTPAMANNKGTGTSFAAPIVTGAVAQLMQKHSILLMRPDLVKAVLLAGATEFIVYSDPASTAPSLQKNCGAGVLNVYNSYCSMNGSSSPKYIYDEFTEGETQATYSATTDYYCPDVLRFALVWNCNSEISSGTHTNPEEYTNELAKLKFTVTAPGGNTTWVSYAERGNVQVVTIDASSGPYGAYTVSVERMDEGTSDIEYSIAVSRCSYIY